MSANINLQDLSIANFDQLLDVDGIQGGRRSYSKKSYSYSYSYSKPSYSRKSRTSFYRKRR
jgi:hypothetical protein